MECFSQKRQRVVNYTLRGCKRLSVDVPKLGDAGQKLDSSRDVLSILGVQQCVDASLRPVVIRELFQPY